jgi:geranylgeranyl pyrophosphate synthase
MQRQQRHDPDTTVEAYLERCALKTGKLFEAACVLGGGNGEYGRLLGIAFQIADDVLDCTGETIETGKVPGTDLHDGTPTLPLLLAARADPVVREALAGGPKEGALVRVAATGALDRSREVALDYASQARACLDGAARREVPAPHASGAGADHRHRRDTDHLLVAGDGDHASEHAGGGGAVRHCYPAPQAARSSRAMASTAR